MKSVIVLTGVCSLAMLLAGCAPELDQTQLSPEEQAWAANFKENYGAWQPPESVPRSVRRDDLVPAPAANPAAGENSTFETQVSVAADSAVAPAVPVAADSAVAPVAPADSVAAPVPADNAAAAAPEVYTVVKGDTLGAIARKYYGRASAWKRIQEANADVLKGKTMIYPGMKLQIPRP